MRTQQKEQHCIHSRLPSDSCQGRPLLSVTGAEHSPLGGEPFTHVPVTSTSLIFGTFFSSDLPSQDSLFRHLVPRQQGLYSTHPSPHFCTIAIVMIELALSVGSWELKLSAGSKSCKSMFQLLIS